MDCSDNLNFQITNLFILEILNLKQLSYIAQLSLQDTDTFAHSPSIIMSI
jgi:hypothetical protein